MGAKGFEGSRDQKNYFGKTIMKTIHDIQLFLEKLDIQSADSLEDQDLDFKEWKIRLFLILEGESMPDITLKIRVNDCPIKEDISLF